MSFEEALRDRLKADATVTAIVGTRIDWDVRPQATAYPALVLETITGLNPRHMKGFSLTSDRVQFSCFANTKKEAVALRTAVLAAIEAPATAGGIEFMGAQDIVRRQAPNNTSTGVVSNEIVEATFFHK